MSMDEKMAYSVHLINEYSASLHNNNVRCEVSEDKGRVLFSNRNFRPGERIFIQPPLHVVQEDPNSDLFKRIKKASKDKKLDFEPLWYWCALNTQFNEGTQTLPPALAVSGLQRMTPIDQQRFLMLFAPDCQEPSDDTKLLMQTLGLSQSLDLVLFEKLLQVWIHNCFEYSDAPLGYSVYFISSFLAHSCLPNCVWHYDDDQNFVLRARTEIPAGRELSVSYLSEDALLQPTPKRQKVLESTKSFLCQCERCTARIDLGRGFRCPHCREGTIFLAPAWGTSRDSHRSVGSPSPPSQHYSTVGHRRSNVVEAGICSRCGRELSHFERLFLVQQERHYIQQMLALDGEEEEEEVEEKKRDGLQAGVPIQPPLENPCFIKMNSDIRFLFTQHWVLSRWLAYAAERLGSDKNVQALQRSHGGKGLGNPVSIQLERLDVMKRIFPTENGAIAWATDEVVDAMLKDVGYSEKGRIGSAEMAQALWADNGAMGFARRAHESLSLLFGRDHEYALSVEEKMKTLRRKIDEAIGIRD